MTITLPSAFLVRLSTSTRLSTYGYSALLPGFILAVVTIRPIAYALPVPVYFLRPGGCVRLLNAVAYICGRRGIRTPEAFYRLPR